MKSKIPFFVCISVMLSLVCVCPVSIAYAQTITLYEQPQTNAKTTGKIDLSKGMVPIFTSKNNDWIKVGDPNNGNVGWIKSSDINQAAGSASSITFTQKIIEDGKQPQTVQIIQYGRPNKLSDAEAQTLISKMHADQLAMQKSFDEMFRNMNDLFQHEWNIMWGPEKPVSPETKPQSIVSKK